MKHTQELIYISLYTYVGTAQFMMKLCSSFIMILWLFVWEDLDICTCTVNIGLSQLDHATGLTSKYKHDTVTETVLIINTIFLLLHSPMVYPYQ